MSRLKIKRVDSPRTPPPSSGERYYALKVILPRHNILYFEVSAKPCGNLSISAMLQKKKWKNEPISSTRTGAQALTRVRTSITMTES